MKSFWMTVCCTLALSFAATLTAADGIEAVVNADLLNIRTGSTLKSPVAVKLKQGEKVTIRRIIGNWAEIDAPAQARGFVSGVFVRDGKTLSEVAVRIKPDPESPKFASFPKGAAIKVVADAGYGWLKVELPAGVRLYTVKYYLNFTMDQSKLEQNEPAKPAAAKTEVKADEAKAAPAAEAKPAAEVKSAAAPETKQEAAPAVEVKQEAKSEVKAAEEITCALKPGVKPESAAAAVKSEVKQEAKPVEKKAAAAAAAVKSEVKQEAKPVEEKVAAAAAKPEIKSAADVKSAIKNETAKKIESLQAEALLALGIDTAKQQGEPMHATGTLIHVPGSSYRATDYALLDEKDENICFICTASPHSLQSLLNKQAVVTGTAYRVDGWKRPVMLLQKIEKK